MTVISPTRWHLWLACQRLSAGMAHVLGTVVSPESIWEKSELQ